MVQEPSSPDSVLTADVVTGLTALTDRTASPSASLSQTYPIGELGSRFTVPYFQEDIYSVPNDLVRLQTGQAILRLMYGYFKKICLDHETVNPGDFPGLLAPPCMDTDQKVLVGTPSIPGVLTLEHIDYAFSKVTAGPGRPNLIMSHSIAQRQYKKVCYDANQDLQYIDWEWIDPLVGRRMSKVLSVDGVPWLVNDLAPIYDPEEPTRYTDIFFLLVGDDEQGKAGRGVFGIIPEERKGDMFVIRQNPAGGAGGSQTFVDVTWPVGLAVGSRTSLSAIRYFTLDVPPLVG
jgi:hypothetical protein